MKSANECELRARFYKEKQDSSYHNNIDYYYITHTLYSLSMAN